jgi:hypothetical protein
MSTVTAWAMTIPLPMLRLWSKSMTLSMWVALQTFALWCLSKNGKAFFGVHGCCLDHTSAKEAELMGNWLWQRGSRMDITLSDPSRWKAAVRIQPLTRSPMMFWRTSTVNVNSEIWDNAANLCGFGSWPMCAQYQSLWLFHGSITMAGTDLSRSMFNNSGIHPKLPNAGIIALVPFR